MYQAKNNFVYNEERQFHGFEGFWWFEKQTSRCISNVVDRMLLYDKTLIS